jgi:hypothetical protein
MDYWPQLLIVVVIVAALWYALQPRYVFLVRIGNDGPRTAQGKVAASFLQQIQEACEEMGVKRGWVGGVPRGKHVQLHFSGSIPPNCRQRIRNAWMYHA